MNANPTISFERLTNRIYLNADWEYRIQLGHYLIFEVYQWLEESEFPRIWDDSALKDTRLHYSGNNGVLM